MHLLIKNREPIPFTFTNTNELLTKYSGAYTTCRTIDKINIIDLPTHIGRLAKVGLNHKNSQGLSLENTYELVMPSVRQVITQLNEEYQQHKLDSETRLTIILTINQEQEIKYDVIVFGELLPRPSQPPIIVSLHKGERKNPEIKHTQWSKDRTVIAQYKKSDEEEIILQSTSSGHLYEGLSSNFGIVRNGTLYTSPKGVVLEGVTLELIFKACKESNIPVKRDFPNIDEIMCWDGAFISSATRGLLQVDRVRVGDKEITLPRSDILQKLSDNLTDQMRKNANDINCTWREVLYNE